MTSYACVILHNMLVRMNQAGAFARDELEEGPLLNIVEELYN